MISWYNINYLDNYANDISWHENYAIAHPYAVVHYSEHGQSEVAIIKLYIAIARPAPIMSAKF